VAVSALGLALLLAAVAACGSSSSSRSSELSKSPIPGLKPGEDPAGQRLNGKRRGGTLTVYTSLDFDSLDPGQSYFTLSYAVDDATQRPLFAYLPNTYSTPSPDMAAYMPTVSNGGISDGGRTVIVHIRPNVHFSPPVDRAVTAADIAYAIERAANPSVNNAYFHLYFGSGAASPLEGAQSPNYHGGPIPGIQTPNRTTIVFHMTRPGAALLIQALTLPLSAPVPQSFANRFDKRSRTSYGTTYLVATGPYMLRSDGSGRIAGIGYEAGKFVMLVRNPNWNPSTDYRPAYLNQIDIKIGGSAIAIGERVLKGSDSLELDTPPPSITKQAYHSYPSQVTFTYGEGINYLALDNAAGPMKNVNVRRAIWAALDRQAIVKAEGGSLFVSPMTHFISPGVIGYQLAGGAAGPRVDYNMNLHGSPRVAKKYMRLAGYPGGRYTGSATIRIVGAGSFDWPPVTQIVNRAFRSLGFRTHVIEVDFGLMYSNFCGVPRREIDACPSVGWVKDFADPQSLLYIPFYGPTITATNNSNWGQVNDPRINSAMAKAAVVSGLAARAEAWARVDRMLVDRAVAVPETFDISQTIESRNVAGVNAVWDAGVWDLDFTSLR
jgi:peptide/nickel transport system substrate-binding protein